MIKSDIASEKRCLEFIHRFKELLDFMDTMTTADYLAIKTAVDYSNCQENMKKIKFGKADLVEKVEG